MCCGACVTLGDLLWFRHQLSSMAHIATVRVSVQLRADAACGRFVSSHEQD